MFAGIAARYDLANRVLSGGLDRWWRAKMARLAVQNQPARVLDLATGSGDLALAIKARRPEAMVIGADFCAPMLVNARRKGLAEVVVADALQLPFGDETFDVVTIAFGLRNMEDWAAALQECRRVIAPGGVLLVLDFCLPNGPWRWIYRPYLHHVLPRIAEWLTGSRGSYQYLGDSIERFPRGEAMCRLLKAAGFSHASSQPWSAGIVAIYTGAR
ncbi:MAG: ubiquinone/menaquinone biosynthesis methyltransferase [Chthoniobacteraceae bacterium]